MSATSITNWLERLGMTEYAQRFAENKIGFVKPLLVYLYDFPGLFEAMLDGQQCSVAGREP